MDFVDAKTFDDKTKSSEIGHLLVDSYSELQQKKKEIEEKIEKLRKEIIELARTRNMGFLYGNSANLSVKEFNKVVYPEDKEILIKVLKKRGLLEEYSHINHFKLSPRILKKEVDNEIIELVKIEKDYRVSVVPKS
jgi:tetrahydromethanopterin S-methyltransferase subunit G